MKEEQTGLCADRKLCREDPTFQRSNFLMFRLIA